MKIQQSPNWFSCLPTAFAIVLDIPVRELINEIGHDGSELIFSNLPEPYSRRSFHPQELLQPLLRRGYVLMIVEAIPIIGANINGDWYPITFPESNAIRLVHYMEMFEGVVVGESQNSRPHAVGWDTKLYYDPNKLEPSENLDLNVREFFAFVKAKPEKK